MAQSTPLKNPPDMGSSELIEEFRLNNQLIGKQREQTGTVAPELSRRTDLIEEQIQRRMAWG